MKYNNVVRNLYDKYFHIASSQKEYLDNYFKDKLSSSSYLYESRVKKY